MKNVKTRRCIDQLFVVKYTLHLMESEPDSGYASHSLIPRSIVQTFDHNMSNHG